MKPILFNTEMVQAILAGRKTTTRRLVKLQANCEYFVGIKYHLYGPYAVFSKGKSNGCELVRFPYIPGNILYMREAWTKLWYVDPDGYTHYDQPMYYYAADGTPDITLFDEDGFEQDDQRIRWCPSIHMPKEIARIFLCVMDVRVERLQDITEEQAMVEGFKPISCHCHGVADACTDACIDCMNTGCLEPALLGFVESWNKTIKKSDLPIYGWDANPWVWVIEFKRCEKPKEAHE